MNQSLVSLIALACVVPLIVATLYMIKKTMMIRNPGNQDIKIINQISLGSRERLLLLQVRSETLLVGVTQQQIRTLHVCSDKPSNP